MCCFGDKRIAAGFTLDSGSVNFYNFILNIEGAYTSTGSDVYEVYLPSNNTLIFENSLVIEDGKFDSDWGSTALLDIRGTYEKRCSDLTNKVCASPDYWVSKRFGPGATTISLHDDSAIDCSHCQIEIDVGEGNNVNLNSNLTLAETYADLIITSGTLNLAADVQVSVADDLVNNSIITCSGTAYIDIVGSITGTPDLGNMTLCYGP